jgi:hypothetical protein
MGTSQSSVNPTRHIHPSASHVKHESSEQIGDDIENTRSRMDETLDELGERLSPRRIIDDVMDYFTGPSRNSGASQRNRASGLSDSAGKFGQNLSRTVRDNPVPTALIGAGLAWLAFGLGQNDDEDVVSRKRRRNLPRDRYFADELDEDDDVYMSDEDYLLESRYQEQGSESDDPSMWDKTKQVATGAVDSVTGAASAVGDAIGDAASATSDAASSAYRSSRRAGRDAYRSTARSSHRAGRGVSRQSQNLSESLSDFAGSASDKYQQASQQYPLAIGAGCMALGMLAGLIVPRTRQEDHWMGETSDELMDDAWQAGEQLVERGQRVATETIDRATESADEHGLTGDSLINRGKRVVSKVAGAAADALDEEDLTPEKLGDDIKSVGQDAGKKISEKADKAAADAKAKAAEIDSDVKKL